VEGKERK